MVFCPGTTTLPDLVVAVPRNNRRWAGPTFTCPRPLNYSTAGRLTAPWSGFPLLAQLSPDQLMCGVWAPVSWPPARVVPTPHYTSLQCRQPAPAGGCRPLVESSVLGGRSAWLQMQTQVVVAQWRQAGYSGLAGRRATGEDGGQGRLHQVPNMGTNLGRFVIVDE